MDRAIEETTAGERRATTGRVLGIDLGSQRIGVAVSDDGRRVASALTVLNRAESHGLPLSLSGEAGPAARAVMAEVTEMRDVLDVPVECCDERYSTVIAGRALAAGGRRPAARRAVVDKVAAAAILQTWLDRQRDWPWPQAGPATPAQ